MAVLIISNLAKFGYFLKSKTADNERVSQCLTCSVCKSGTHEIQIINGSFQMPIQNVIEPKKSPILE
jgi:hypothetical protein